jgi:hypothetical protein
MKSRKMFAYENTDKGVKYRVLVPDTSTKYDPKNHFMSFEESDYLADALKGVPYATFTTDQREEMEDLLMNGYKDKENRVWIAFFAYWKDQEGHAILVPEGSSIRDLRDVGILTSMKTPADFMKVGKYTNRLFAALPKPAPIIDQKSGEVRMLGFGVWGDEVSWNEADQIAIIKLDIDGVDLTDEDKEISIKYVDLKTLNDEQKALVDGAIVISEKAARVLNLSKEPRLGMAWRGTFGTARGLGKGHILYKNDMNVDVVIYGPKTILKTERFFFGSMGELHVGVPHTDRQAFVNFHFHRPGLAVDLAKTFMREVLEASKNEQALRRLFLRHTVDLQHSDLDQEAWVLRRALAYGVSFLRFPGLYRRVVRYLMKKVMACDLRARIPMNSIAGYGYVLPDPNAIDAEGDVHPENAIPEGHIVYPDVKSGTKVVCYRQPSENTNAWVALNVMYRPEYKRFADRGICLLGRGAHKVLSRLGGGDMDDQFVIVHDPKWVEAFHTMRPYPETQKLSAQLEDEETIGQRTELARITDELTEGIRDKNTSHYTNKHVSWQIEMAKNARAGIGPVVNYGMMDLLLSDPDHTQSMLADLTNLPEATGWLEDYRSEAYRGEDALPGTTPFGYHARRFMTNLEVVIDGNVKDSTLLAQLGDVAGTIKAFHANVEVYPASMAERIPMSKIKAGGYVIARSLTCRALEMIRLIRDRLSDIFVEREWTLVAPADKDLRVEYPFEREISIKIRGEWKRTPDGWKRLDEDVLSLMDIWGLEWRDELAKPGSHEGAYERICNIIAMELYGEDDDYMERLAVELYFQTYKTYQSTPKVDEASGRLRGFNDGLLWTPIFGNHFINALRKARLSGFYKAADIFPQFRRRLMDNVVAVEIRNHLVYVQDTDDQYTVTVGTVWGKSPDGRFKMDGGLIEFRASQPICQPADPDLISQKPLTRIFPSSVQPEDKKDEAKGVFGKLLNKALTILK